MEQRGIKKEQVEEALKEPDIILPTKDKHRKRVMKKFGSKTLDVIYKPISDNKIILVTVVWLKKEDRKVER